MKKQLVTVLAMLVCVSAIPAYAADTEKTMADISAKYKNSVALLTFTIHQDTGDTGFSGQAVCVTPEGVFMTTTLDPNLRPETIVADSMKLTFSGSSGKVVKAKFRGIDPVGGLAFVEVDKGEKGDWMPLVFAEAPNLVVGQEVFSMGILGGDGNRTTYIGTAHVSAILRVPNPLVYVTGGKLTSICSPVFAADGRVIGIIGRQIPLAYQSDTNKGAVALPLRGEDETSFFTPSSEIAPNLKKIPAPGEPVRRLPWIGVNSFSAVNEETAKLETPPIDLPAIMVDQVIPKEPADLAGLKDTDKILAINGKPLEKLGNPTFAVQNFMYQLMKFQIGETIELTIRRTGDPKPKTVKVGVGPMPKLPNEASRIYDQSLGMICRERVPLDQYLMKEPASKVDGLIIIALAKQGLAESYGIGAGDIVQRVNDQPIKSIADYQKIIDAIKNQKPPAQSIKLTVWHDKQAMPYIIMLPR